MQITHINLAKCFRGGERQTFLLINELAKENLKQKLIMRYNTSFEEVCKNINNLEIIKIKKPYFLSLNKLKNSQIIHAHETKAAQLSFFANLIFKIPYIITRRVDNKIKNNFLNAKMYKNASFCACLSKAVEKTITRLSKDVNIKIIPSAFSKAKENSKEIKKIKKKFKDKFLLGNIGELDNGHKGQFYLLEVAKKLQITHPQIHLIFLGKGEDLQDYKNQVKDLNNVTFEGFVSNTQDYIKCFDLFVFPSLHEGLGSSLLDVMQGGVPIIASKVGGIPELIRDGENGLLVPAKNSDEIYKKIVLLYEKEDLRKNLSSKALAGLEKYSPLNMAKSYMKLYELL